MGLRIARNARAQILRHLRRLAARTRKGGLKVKRVRLCHHDIPMHGAARPDRPKALVSRVR